MPGSTLVWIGRGDEEVVAGWGAVSVDTPSGWVCPQCSKPLRKIAGRHTYADGTERCTPCAEAWARANGFVRPRLGFVPTAPKRASEPSRADPSGQYRLPL